MFQKLKLATVPVMLVLGLGFLVGAGILAYKSTLSYRSASEWEERTQEVISALWELLLLAVDAETAQRGYALTENEAFLNPLLQTDARLATVTVKVRDLIQDSPSQKELHQKAIQVLSERMKFLHQTVELIKQGQRAEAVKLIASGQGKSLMDQFRHLVGEMRKNELMLLNERQQKTESNFGLVSKTIAFVNAVGFLILFLAILYLRSDIKTRARIESELRIAEQKALEASELKSTFLANMSHEIRTPLNGIIGMTKMLKKTSLNPVQTDYLSTIEDSSQGLLLIINNILDISKIESGKFTLEESHFDLRSLLGSSISILRFSAEEKRIEIRTQIAEDVPPFLIGDALRIRQVLMNLIGNAIKFSENAPIEIRVFVQENKNSDMKLGIEIIDRGVGFDVETKSRLFQPFSQGDVSTTRRFGGTGLGLAICRQLVKMMGGEIDVDSIPGLGSKFHFTLQLKVAKYQVIDNLRDKNASNFESLMLKILVAEDNLTNQKVIESMLRSMGCEVECVMNGRLAVEKLKEKSFDIVLMDCHMPEMDGYQATQTIRENPPLLNLMIPILATTANAVKGDKEMCLEVGMDDYIVKPISYDDLFYKLSIWKNVQSHPIDKKVLQKFMQEHREHGGERLVQELVELFSSTGREAINALRVAIQKSDRDEIKNTAHSFKSTSNNVGAVKMARFCKLMELLPTSTPMTVFQQLVKELEAQFILSCEVLEKEFLGNVAA